MRGLVSAFALAVVLFAPAAFAYTSPGNPTGYINDFAHVLSEETISSLESELSAFQASTTNEIAVVIVPHMGGDYIENYSAKLFEEWKIGKKDQDNGVLLMLSMQEHAMRIEVGYGLEGSLVDSEANNILERMKPGMRSNDPDAAVTTGVRLIEDAIRGSYSASHTSNSLSSFLGQNFEWIFFAIIFGLQWFASILGRSKSWWAGGILGIIAGLSLGWFVAFSALATLFATALLGTLGLIFDYIVSNTYHFHTSRGTSAPWWVGGGSSGSSSGGFGGFGGGSSGGGGASNSW